MAIVPHDFIQNRADFHTVLAELIDETRKLVAGSPGFPPYGVILRQLEAIDRWTSTGLDPSKDDRKSIDMGLVIVRELEPAADPVAYRFNARVSELGWYLKHWRSDADWQALDDDDDDIYDPDEHAP